MTADWIDMELGEFAELKRGYDLPKREREIGIIPLVSSSGTTDLHSVAKVKGPGVITGRYGTIGQVFYVEEDFWPLNTTLYVQNFKNNNPLFVYYLLKTISYEDYSDKAAVPGINRNHLHKAKIRVPVNPSHQQEIAEKLWVLDSKIELNRQTNQTLEQIAQAIFKSWFVDFEPTRAKIAALEAGGSEDDALLAAMQAIAGSALFATDAADADAQTQLARLQAEHPEQYATLRATAELFPSAMQESELGEIPEGWEVTDFGAVSVCFDKHRIPLSKAQRDKRKGHIPYYGATSVMDYVDEHIFDDIFLLLGEDGSVLQKDDTPFIQYIWGKAWVNNHAHVLQGKGNVSTEQILLFMKNQNIAPYVTGAVQLKLNQKNMNSIPFIKATDEVCIAFNLLLKPMFADLRNREDESRKLSSLRDTLLPKLLSGEIDVSALADNTEANA